jgi:hypothetical protein
MRAQMSRPVGIWKLGEDELTRIFEALFIKDIRSVAKTCKHMHTATKAFLVLQKKYSETAQEMQVNLQEFSMPAIMASGHIVTHSGDKKSTLQLQHSGVSTNEIGPIAPASQYFEFIILPKTGDAEEAIVVFEGNLNAPINTSVFTVHGNLLHEFTIAAGFTPTNPKPAV